MNEYFDKDLHNLPEEKVKRIETCIKCENNQVVDCSPTCVKCSCPISALTMFSFKTCPIGKW